jgi:hypothetical protein
MFGPGLGYNDRERHSSQKADEAMNVAERLARLEKASEPGDWWHPHKPEKGDGKPQPSSIAGEVLARSTDTGAYGDRQVVKVLTPDGQVWRVYEDGSVLERLFGDQNPQPGDLVFVAYKGMVTGRGGGKSDYHNWVMVVDKGSGAVTASTAEEPEIPEDEQPALYDLREQPAEQDEPGAQFGDDVPY